MSNILHMETETVEQLSQLMKRTLDEIKQQTSSLVSDTISLQWEGFDRGQFDTRLNQIAKDINTQTESGYSIQNRLQEAIINWEKVGSNGLISNGNETTCLVPFPVPGPTPVPSREALNNPININKVARNVFDFIDEWSKPLDWVGDNKKASKAYHEMLKDLGRILNDLDHTRGYVKKLDAIGDLSEGSAKTISVLSDVLALHDFNQYFHGNMTNAEIAETATKALVPIPVIGSKLANWMVSIMPNPEGKWHGLIPPAYSE